jgi:hypothetical protein
LHGTAFLETASGVVGAFEDQGLGLSLIGQVTDLTLGMPDTAVVLRGGQTLSSGPTCRLAEASPLLHQSYFGI